MDNSRIGYFIDDNFDIKKQVDRISDESYQFFIVQFLDKDGQNFNPYCDLQIRNECLTNLFVTNVVYSFDDDFNKQKELLSKQIEYTCYLGLPSLLIPCPKTSKNIAYLASVINSKISSFAGLDSLGQIWIHLNLSDNQNTDVWFQWNQLRNQLINSTKIGVAIEFSSVEPCIEEEMKRWSGEPVKVLIINTKCFLVNKKGFPVLSKEMQKSIALLRNSTSFDLHLVIRGEPLENLALNLYYQYLDHLKSLEDKDSFLFKYARGYEDYLQIPLQPLNDNLESMSYEVFEKDPVKYVKYKEAICEALNSIKKEEIVLIVVGAGRGPLVTASIQAAFENKKKLKLFAVEKNRNAIPTLNYLKKTLWIDYDNVNVEILYEDMRNLKMNEKADIVVSELLGSLGDNELSPECLDGLKNCTDKNTISIPQSYTSFLAPIMSYKLHSKTKANRELDKPTYKAFENQYVVYMKNFYLIDEPQKLFSFDHKDLTVVKDNKRFDCLKFKPKIAAMCHGFAGYFESTLFNNIKISTVIGQETKDMFSWFPIYIPINNPFLVTPDKEIEIMFWRNLDKHKVWYEWTISSPVSSEIHNVNGRSQTIIL